MNSVNDDRGLLCRVAPFRYLRIKDYLHLPVAFRSLSRLSSALSAKASALRPIQLNLLRNAYLKNELHSLSSLQLSIELVLSFDNHSLFFMMYSVTHKE